MPGFTLGVLAVVQLAGLSCLSSRSLRFFSLNLQRNILSTSLARFSFSILLPTVSSDSYFTSSERKSSSSPLPVFFFFALTHHFCYLAQSCRESRSQLTCRSCSWSFPPRHLCFLPFWREQRLETCLLAVSVCLLSLHEVELEDQLGFLLSLVLCW